MRKFFPVTTANDRTEVNLTPMLDVVFIMLIFFIVTAVFVREQGLNVPDTSPNTDSIGDVPPIVVDVMSGRRLLVAGREVDERLLGAQLARFHAENPKAAVVIRPRPDAATEMVVKVMDNARQAGIAAINLAAR